MSYRHLVRFISRLMAGVQSIINSGYICDASKRELLCFSLCAAQMFRIASGDPWPGSLPILNEDGSMEYSTCLYMCTFIVIVCWVRDPHRGETRAATTGLAEPSRRGNHDENSGIGMLTIVALLASFTRDHA